MSLHCDYKERRKQLGEVKDGWQLHIASVSDDVDPHGVGPGRKEQLGEALHGWKADRLRLCLRRCKNSCDDVERDTTWRGHNMDGRQLP